MRKIVLLVAGVLAALSLTAAPASSAPAVASTLCNGWETPNSAYFTSLRALTTVASGARGGIGRGEPSLNANTRQCRSVPTAKRTRTSRRSCRSLFT